eukprot:gb/GECG01011116.1/.p1 GENE.gb/GECG01011116.1/~~gb/GECG01011116.1/.p1  ORF type:complete len:645 (+),score=93.83 gb/GECG01011116.1/:1-1935(+)
MDQIYFVYEPPGGSHLEPPICLYKYGNYCYCGPVELANGAQTLDQLPGALRYLQSIQGTIPFYCETDHIPQESIHYESLNELNEALDFIYEELSTVDEALAPFIESEPWLDDDNAALYFEFETQASYDLQNAQVVFAKTFREEVLLTAIFHQGTFYVALHNAADTEQGLVDTIFPQIYGKRQGIQLRAYDHPVFTKMSVWESSDPVPDPQRVAIGDQPTESSQHVNTDLSGVEGSYTQIYVINRPKNIFQGSTKRDALFRFGNWCYAGKVDFGVGQLHLGDVPDVLPALQRQQGNLAYFCDAGSFPDNNSFSEILRVYTASIRFLTNEMINVEDRIAQLADTGVTSWIDEDWAAAFFEMQFGHVPALEETEVIASKIYTGQGIILHCLWFAGSLYCVLADAAEDQPLLDVAFPDVTARCRGVQVKSYSNEDVSNFPGCPPPRRLNIWEGRRRGVPGVGFGEVAAIKDDQFSAIMSGSPGESTAEKIRKKARMRAQQEAQRRQEEADQKKLAKKPQAENVESKEEEKAVEENDDKPSGKEAEEDEQEGEQEERPHQPKSRPAVAYEPAEGPEAGASGTASNQHASAATRGEQGDEDDPAEALKQVKAPHHLPPMGGGSRLKGLQKLDNVGPAPWDDSGKPKDSKK